MTYSPKYTDEEHDRLEQEAEQLIAEAEAALDRARDMLDDFGLDLDDDRLSKFLSEGEPSEELDALRAELFGGMDEQEALLAEEKRLMEEMNLSPPGTKPRRRRMARV